MAHFAKLDDNNKVIEVHVVNNEAIMIDGSESEQAGIDLLTQIHGHTNWKQCSYNASFRKHYPAPGFTYDESRDAFIPPKEYTSWVLNEETCNWEPTVLCPTDGKVYDWHEPSQQWIETLTQPNN